MRRGGLSLAFGEERSWGGVQCILCGDYSILRGGWGLVCWLRCATGDEMKMREIK